MPTPEQIADRLNQLHARGWNPTIRYDRDTITEAILDHRSAVKAINELYEAGILASLITGNEET